jgi:hypothetical protein
MQMNNIYIKNQIPSDYFNSFYHHITLDLFEYLFDNLEGENYQTFRWNLKTALTINVNE